MPASASGLRGVREGGGCAKSDKVVCSDETGEWIVPPGRCRNCRLVGGVVEELEVESPASRG